MSKIKHHISLARTGSPKSSDDEPKARPLDFGLIRRLFSYTRPYAAKRNALFAIVIIRSIQLPLVAWALSAVINGPITNKDPKGIILGALGFLTLIALTDLTMHFRQRYALELGESVVRDLREKIFDKLMTMPMSFYNRTKLGRIISRMTSDVEAVRTGVQNVLFVSMVQGGQMLGSGALMCYYNPRLFSLIVAMVPAIWLLNRYFKGRMSKATREVQESFSRITATLAETVKGIRVTQGFVRAETNAGLFRDLVEDHSGYNMGVSRNTAIYLPLLELNSQLFIAAILFVGGYGVLSPEWQMPVGDLVAFFFLTNLFFSPISALGNQYNQAMVAMAGAERVFRILDAEPDWKDDENAIAIEDLKGEVIFNNVCFSYEKGKPVLHNISFKTEPGQTIALVGHTGSGKSSIINLVSKFYVVDSGEILIDGRNINNIQQKSLHEHMGLVLQQNFLFTGSVMENIRMGNPLATDEEVIDAVRRLDCLDLVEAMPDGFQTIVGERGSGLSQGQQQLVCFARAFLADPRILILDEATSSVDTVTEARLQQALSQLMQGRTNFVVAHRLSTIRNADQILVLEHGHIKERGTHSELLQNDGIYAQLYSQFVSEDE